MRWCALLLAVVLVASPSSASAGPDPHGREGLRRALAVLHRWDEQRARAWADSDQQALRALYARGSRAAGADVRLLRSYTTRGFVVRRLVTQVFGLRVVRSTPSHLDVRVLDRVAGGEVVTPTGVVPLSSSRPAVRRIVLERRAATWRVASVSGWG